MNRLSCLLLAAALPIPVLQAAFVLDYDLPPTGALGGQGGGQTFRPSDTPGLESASTVDLASVSFWRGAGGTVGSQVSPTTYLVIYDGNPDTASQVGASSNSLDIAIDDADGSQYTWNFDNLTLDANTTYWAVMSNNPVDDNVLQPTGTWLQMSLQTVGNVYSVASDRSSIIANRNPHSSGNDLRFTATFVPEPSVMLLSAAGLMLGTLRRRR